MSMKNKNQKSCRLRAIKRTDLISDLSSATAASINGVTAPVIACGPYPRIGLFASQERYRGLRLFAVYINGYVDRVFSSYSEAKKYVRCFRSWYETCDVDIVLFEAK